MPVGACFADFACRARRLIVEVDGATHASEAEVSSDAARTMALEQSGYRVFRVTNEDVFRNLGGVLDSILHELEQVE